MLRPTAILLFTTVFSVSCFAEQPETLQRIALFEKIERDTELLEDLVDDENWSQVIDLSLMLEKNVNSLKALFPKTSIGEGRSKEKIWKNWPQFEEKLDSWSQHFKHLALSTQSVDQNQIESSLDSATSTCRSCHMQYRSLW